MDGSLLHFAQAERRTAKVQLLPAWEKPKSGDNDGVAGVAFGAEANRGAAGGQVARRIRVTNITCDAGK